MSVRWLVVVSLAASCTGIVGSPAVDGGEAGDAGAADAGGCPDGQHQCGAACLADDSVDSCGDRCAPCQGPTGGSASCVARACVPQCPPTTVLCNGACRAASQGPCVDPLNAPANTFVKLVTDGAGTRVMPAIVHDATSGQFLMIGGWRGFRRAMEPYDVLALSLEEKVWKNVHPEAKVATWGGEVAGNSAAPMFNNPYWADRDPEGVSRPNFEVDSPPGTAAYQQYALVEPERAVVFSIRNRTFRYDLATRSWSFPQLALEPSGGPTKLLHRWGSMGALGAKVLLFGGAGVENDAGEPGTWLFEAGQWRQVTSAPRPSPRALAALSVDPVRKKALLFGGDGLDRLHGDTWLFDFDTETWQQLAPAHAPKPRSAAKLIYLPTSGETVLFGGLEFTSTTDYLAAPYRPQPWAIWRFDWTQRDWQLVKAFAMGEQTPSLSNTWSIAAAASPGDSLVLFVNTDRYDATKSETWAIHLDPTARDSAGEPALLATSGESFRQGSYSKAWYADAGSPDATEQAAIDARLAAAPDNKWIALTPPKQPLFNMDWGTAVFDTDTGNLLRWSGGHSAYPGNNVVIYRPSANRFDLSAEPEFLVDACYSNGGIGGWTPRARPFMVGHSWKFYAYSPKFRRAVIHTEPFTFFFDPATNEFDRTRLTQSMGTAHSNMLVAVPNGVLAWTRTGLWSLETIATGWTRVTTTGATLPSPFGDTSSIVYDSGRNRALLVADRNAQMVAVDLGTWQATVLDPAGRTDMAAKGPTGHIRESVFLADDGLSLVFASYDFSTANPNQVPAYDVALNQWFAYSIDTSELRERYGNSFAVVWDPGRRRIWGLGQRNAVYLLKFDKQTATKVPLN